MTVKKEFLNKRDLRPNNFHRTLGKKILMIDLDCLEFYFVAGQIKNVAIIDYKHPNAKRLSKDDVSTRVQMNLANELKLPFFIVITYLDPEVYSIPMLYVIAVNDIAKSKFKSFKSNKVWTSAFGYASFQHWLRGKKIDVDREPELAGLSDKTCTYKLPIMDL